MDGDDWKVPRRNGSYVCIGRITRSMADWAKLSAIERHTLFMMRKRHGLSYMVQRIKQGIAGTYDPLWWHNRAGKGVIRDPKTRDKRRCLTISN
jgi:hypothetical protein